MPTTGFAPEANSFSIHYITIVNYEYICSAVQQIARKAGHFIAEERKNFSREAVEIKGQSDFVSYVDKKSEEMIVAALKLLLPGSGFITEEGTAGQSGEKYLWIIDPLDGTTNFIHGMPPYAVSIALMEDKELVAGVVYEVTNDECFYAWKGGKAWLNGQPIRVTEAATSKDTLIATGFPYYDFGRMDAYIATLRYFMQNSHGLRRIGSAATDMAYLAAGRFDGFWELGLHAWDIAAGAVIVREAGGKVSDFSGGDNFLFSGELVASNSNFFNEFQQVIERNFVKAN